MQIHTAEETEHADPVSSAEPASFALCGFVPSGGRAGIEVLHCQPERAGTAHGDLQGVGEDELDEEATIYSITEIRQGLQTLYRDHPDIHVNVSLKSPRIRLQNQPVRLIGVYRGLFRIEDRTGKKPVQYTLQYVDVFTGDIEVRELKDVLH